MRYFTRFALVLMALLLTACYTVCSLPLFLGARDTQRDAEIELTTIGPTNQQGMQALNETLTATYGPRADPLLLTATAFAAPDTATPSPFSLRPSFCKPTLLSP